MKKNTVACQFLNNPTNNLVTAFYIFTNGHKGANLRCSQTFPLIQGKVFARRIIATIPAIGYTNFYGALSVLFSDDSYLLWAQLLFRLLNSSFDRIIIISTHNFDTKIQKQTKIDKNKQNKIATFGSLKH